MSNKTKDCEVCGNPIPAQAFTCQFCNSAQSVENFPKRGSGLFDQIWGKGVSVHYLSLLLKPIDGKLIVDGINEKGAGPHIDIFLAQRRVIR